MALAQRARISPFHFARLFRATVGMPPHQFVSRQRIQKSFGLMKEDKLTLAQVAVESGFHDQPHFTRAFHRYFGTRPAGISLAANARSIEQVFTIRVHFERRYGYAMHADEFAGRVAVVTGAGKASVRPPRSRSPGSALTSS